MSTPLLPPLAQASALLPPKRAIAFIDGQNLFHAAAEMFGRREPDYDVKRLVERVCGPNGWKVQQIRFYTGMPDEKEAYYWHHYWSSKLRGMRAVGVQVIARPMRYRQEDILLPLNRSYRGKTRLCRPDGTQVFPGTKLYSDDGRELPVGTKLSATVAKEKGIDVRIALDVIHLAHRKEYDVGVIFSQDQDLAELVPEIKMIATEQGRLIELYSAFPHSPAAPNARGINSTTWIRIDQAMYEACIDNRPYGRRR